MAQDYEIIPHTADIKIRVYGKTPEELFKNALIGMFQTIEPITEKCKITNGRLVCPDLPKKRQIVVQSIDLNALLVDFLSQALYLSDVHNEAYLDATITSLTQRTVHATLHGIPIEGFANVEIKAVTYHDLNIHQVDERWQTDIVFDI